MNPSEVEDPSFTIESIGGKKYKVLDKRGYMGPKLPHVVQKSNNRKAPRNDAEPEDAESESYGMDHANLVTDDIESLVIEDGMCKVSIEVAKIVFKKLSFEIKQLEIDYQCRVVHLPDRDLLEIKSANRKSVVQVYGELKEAIEEKTLSLPPSHFICFPLANPSVTKKVREFRESLPTNFQEAFLPRDTKLHATLCVLHLHTKQSIEAAVAAIEKFRLAYDKPEAPMMMTLRGLYSMAEDSSKTRVVYSGAGSPSLTGAVNRLATVLFKCLVESEAATWERLRKGHSVGHGNVASVKLHATLINSKYAEKGEPLDARDLIDNFANFDFGTSELSEIRLCEISGASSEDRAFYKTLATVKL